MLSSHYSTRLLTLGLLAAAPFAAQAQDTWNGLYVGGYAWFQQARCVNAPCAGS